MSVALQEAFGRVGADYATGRPGYPAAAIERAAVVLGLEPGDAVADVAAGTGKLTAELLRHFADVVAVEPERAMRELLAVHAPGARVLDGRAERLPLADGSVRAVFVAQAFHWFDAEAAGREIARGVGPGGGLVVLWNGAASGAPGPMLVDLLGDLLLEHRPAGFAAGDHARWIAALDRLGLYEPVRREAFLHAQRLTLDHALAQVASYTFVAALPDAPRAALLARVRERLAPWAPLEVPLRCDLFSTQVVERDGLGGLCAAHP